MFRISESLRKVYLYVLPWESYGEVWPELDPRLRIGGGREPGADAENDVCGYRLWKPSEHANLRSNQGGIGRRVQGHPLSWQRDADKRVSDHSSERLPKSPLPQLPRAEKREAGRTEALHRSGGGEGEAAVEASGASLAQV